MIGTGLFDVYLQMTSGVISSLASKRTAVLLGRTLSALGTVGFGIIPMIIGLALFGIGNLTFIYILLSLVAGIFLAFGFVARYISLYTEQITNVSMLGQIQPAVIVLAGIFLFGEKVSLIGLVGMIMILVGSVFVLTNNKLKLNRKLVPIVLGSVSWGIYWILLIYVISSTGNVLLPLFAARALGTLILLVFLFGSKSRMLEGANSIKSVGRKHLLVDALIAILLTGIGNGLGDTMFGYVITYKIAAIGTAISSSLGLILVAIFAYFLYKDKLSGIDKIGFLIMLAGIFLLNFG